MGFSRVQGLGFSGVQYFEMMEEIVKEAERSYRELTDETEGFYDYFYEATVVNEISLMNIGNRPSRRNAAVRDKSSLRAIPWVFGWSQVKKAEGRGGDRVTGGKRMGGGLTSLTIPSLFFCSLFFFFFF